MPRFSARRSGIGHAVIRGELGRHGDAGDIFRADGIAAARQATRAESMPPLRPSTQDLKPHLAM